MQEIILGINTEGEYFIKSAPKGILITIHNYNLEEVEETETDESGDEYWVEDELST